MNLPSRLRYAETRSRVTPGMSWTMLMRLPTRALRRLLLPTLGRPTMATTGLLTVMPPLNGSGRNCAMRALSIRGGGGRLGLVAAFQLGLEDAVHRDHPRRPGHIAAAEGEELPVDHDVNPRAVVRKLDPPLVRLEHDAVAVEENAVRRVGPLHARRLGVETRRRDLGGVVNLERNRQVIAAAEVAGLERIFGLIAVEQQLY